MNLHCLNAHKGRDMLYIIFLSFNHRVNRAIFVIFIDSKTVSWAYDGIKVVRLFLSKYEPICNDIFQEGSASKSVGQADLCFRESFKGR
jgi:hypothetical protein